MTALGLYLPLIFWSFIMIFPFWYMIVVCTRPQTEIFTMPPPMFMNGDFVQGFINNYQKLLEQLPFWRNLWNSFYISSMQTLVSSFFVALAGFGFAMYRFKAKNFLFGFMLFTMMIPSVVSMIPFFIMIKTLGWLNTPKAIWIPGLASAMGIFLMTQYIRTSITRDLVDAARIDGSSEFGIFIRIVFPLITPALGSYGILTFLGSWNNYMQALVVLRDKETYTVPVAIGSLRGMQSVDYGAIMVGTVITIIPLLIVFVMFSRLIIRKVTEGSLRE